MIGRTLAHYRILDQIGAGGMGVVYRALDTQLERAVALKVVGEQAQVDENARARLLREARTASALNHLRRRWSAARLPGRLSGHYRPPRLALLDRAPARRAGRGDLERHSARNRRRGYLADRHLRSGNRIALLAHR
jgi:serine/threonine protein kinase